jgi:hypothetical protein
MYLNKYARLVAITLAIACLASFRPAFSQECAAYSWNDRSSLRGGCKSPGARCTVLDNTQRLGTCKTKFAHNPNERECECSRLPLRRSATGGDVKLAQEMLGILADGKFGKMTEAAVRAFQLAHDLVSDGIVGPKTWAALDVVAAPISK